MEGDLLSEEVEELSEQSEDFDLSTILQYIYRH
jgi:hypothetical protein